MEQMMYGSGALWGSVLLFIVMPIMAVIGTAIAEDRKEKRR